MTADADAKLRPDDHRALRRAIEQLERQSLVGRIAQLTGTPVDLAIRYLPNSVSDRLRGIIENAMLACADVAVNSLDATVDLEPSPPWMGKVLTGLSGGVGGFFGVAALPFELPLTTTLMLRSIATIARDEGEDLGDIQGRLACLEVFALGGGRDDHKELHLKYFAARTVLTRLTQDVGRHLMERGAINASSPVIARLVGEIVSRFGFAVSDRFATALVPVLGAFGGAALNVMFTEHFERVARAHFTVRRLERTYGAEAIRRHYDKAAAPAAGKRALRLAAAD